MYSRIERRDVIVACIASGMAAALSGPGAPSPSPARGPGSAAEGVGCQVASELLAGGTEGPVSHRAGGSAGSSEARAIRSRSCSAWLRTAATLPGGAGVGAGAGRADRLPPFRLPCAPTGALPGRAPPAAEAAGIGANSSAALRGAAMGWGGMPSRMPLGSSEPPPKPACASSSFWTKAAVDSSPASSSTCASPPLAGGRWGGVASGPMRSAAVWRVGGGGSSVSTTCSVPIVRSEASLTSTSPSAMTVPSRAVATLKGTFARPTARCFLVSTTSSTRWWASLR